MSSVQLHFIIFNNNLLHSVNYCSDMFRSKFFVIFRCHKLLQLLHQLNIFIHSRNRVYVKLDSGISSCEEGLITDFWTKILHQCLFGIILYHVITVKCFNIFILFHIFLFLYLKPFCEICDIPAAQTLELPNDGQELRPKHVEEVNSKNAVHQVGVKCHIRCGSWTLYLLTWRICWASNNASRW